MDEEDNFVGGKSLNSDDTYTPIGLYSGLMGLASATASVASSALRWLQVRCPAHLVEQVFQQCQKHDTDLENTRPLKTFAP